MQRRPIVNPEVLRREMRPGSEWATASGQRLRARRETLGLTIDDVSGLVAIPFQTIWRAEQGTLVPRDYLKVAVSQVLGCKVTDIWPWPAKTWVAEVAGAVA